jgi:Putative MetA-pathway of phenol degradation
MRATAAVGAARVTGRERMTGVRHDTTRASVLRHWLCALMVTSGAAAAADQSREDAWWTGPMLAPSAATLPQGHVLVEPYLFDVMTDGRFDMHGTRHASAREHDIGSLSYILYGLTDRVSVGLIPRFGFNEPAGAPNSSRVGVGDFSLQAGYGLTRFQDGRLMPAISLVIDETLPTGRYERLGRASDGFGAGAYTTGLSIYSQDYLWMPNGRILRVRLDLTYAASSSVGVHDVSVYGTSSGFRGRAYPGDSFTADAAGEYSLTRNWVLALDIVYQHNGSTRVSGSLPPAAGVTDFRADSGSGYSLGLAPAIEYNWNSRVGLLVGVRIIGVGRNATASVTPAIALNMVY